MKGSIVAAALVFLAGAFLSCRELRANPQGGTVAAGSANINSTAPNTLTVDQSSHRVIINWRDFSIGPNEVTKFVQPSSTAEALNRVVTGNPSLLYGTLQANGRVFLINQNGILVGKGAEIDTAGFTASTLDLSDAAFLAGKSLHFSGNSAAAINNLGAITALGGDVFLIAQTVENSGQINAPAGTVGLAAGSDVVLVQRGSERLCVVAGNASAPAAVGVDNAGQIEAASAELKAAGGNIYALAINNDGAVRATGVVNENGHVVLKANGGNIQNSGTLVANNKNGSGGQIVVDGGHNPTSPSTVINSGDVEAQGKATGTKGGTVEILGDDVGLFGNGRVDVSGAAGGGTALIGGGLHGQDPSVSDADRTYIDQDATIAADALSKGNGGTVVVWGNDATAFYGNISAQGGARGGEGGFAEVSGENELIYSGLADLLAPRGATGALLLDPKMITIQTGGPDNISGNEFFTQNPSAAVTIGPDRLIAALNNANVFLQANTDVNINNSVDASGNRAAGTLTVQAGRSIFVADNVAIKVNGGFLARFNDDNATTKYRDPGAGVFSMGTGSSIIAPGRILIIAGGLSADSLGPNTVSANTGDMTLTTLSTTSTKAGDAGGSITLNNNAVAGKNITISGTVTANGADNDAGAGGDGGAITMTATGNLTVNSVTSSGGNGTSGAGGAGGSISLSASGGTLSTLTVGSLLSQGGNSTDAAGGRAGNMTLSANGILNVGAITSTGGNSINDVGGDAGNVSLSGNGGIAVNGLIATQGGTGTSDGSASTITLASQAAITFNNSITASSVSSHSGTTGSGDTTFGAGVQINADSQSYQAGNGTGSATVDLSDNTPAFRNTAGTAEPDAFTYRQDAAMTDANLPDLVQFGGTAPTTYTLETDNGSLTLNAGANVAGSGLILSATGAITFNASLTLASLTSHSGESGLGNTTFGAGVQINADSQSYQAGDGTGSATVDLLGNTPTFQNTAGAAAPDSFTFRQDEAITDANLPVLSQFGGTAPATYTIQSDNGAVTLNAGANVAGSALTLSAAGTITLNASLTLASLDSHSGVSGLGNTTFGAGVQINADSQSYQAGNGTGSATVDLHGNTPMFQNTAGTAAPDSFTFQQDAAIADADLPDLSQFGGTVPATYTIQSDHGAVTLDTGSKVGGSVLTLSASGTLTINDTLNLASLSASGSSIALNGGTITTTGTQTYNSSVTLGNDTVLNGSSVTFKSTVDGSQGLTINGDAVLGGAVGNGTALNSIHVTGTTAMNAQAITTTGAQMYDGAVTLGNDALLISSSGGITFGSTLDGAHQLALAARAGTLTLSGAVGGSTPLTQLDIESANTTVLNADISTSVFSIQSPSIFTGPRVIRADSMNIGDTMTGTGRLTLEPLTDGSSIVLGGSGVSGTLDLTTADLSFITADVLQIGNATAGDITVRGPVRPNVTVLSLENAGSVVENSGSKIAVPQLAIRTAGPVLLAPSGSSGNDIHFLAVQFTGGSAKQRVLVVNNTGAPNLVATVDGVTGINPASSVKFIVNGFGSDSWMEQLASLTYHPMPALTLSTAHLSTNPNVDRKLISSQCGPGCVPTLGVTVPWSTDEETGEPSGWAGKVEDRSPSMSEAWPVFGVAASPAMPQ
ncbi:MAG TPA: filamentous hemagglutinin N-terminal domain-containing protein [Verrucomicrobiae bacterium]|nr:filamentous hemagglutinin N-terminal domain-containing protein [Verrucomicrobiae bacterium]